MASLDVAFTGVRARALFSWHGGQEAQEWAGVDLQLGGAGESKVGINPAKIEGSVCSHGKQSLIHNALKRTK